VGEREKDAESTAPGEEEECYTVGLFRTNSLEEGAM
jgi:hypothetical protein